MNETPEGNNNYQPVDGTPEAKPDNQQVNGAPAPNYGYQPVNGTPAPNYGYQPANGAPAPNYGYKPANGTPAPNYGYQPVNGAPAPNYGYQPVNGAPAPNYGYKLVNGAPAPNYGYKPANGTPAPNYGYKPVNGAPAPNYGYKPVNGAPAPNFGNPPVNPVPAANQNHQPLNTAPAPEKAPQPLNTAPTPEKAPQPVNTVPEPVKAPMPVDTAPEVKKDYPQVNEAPEAEVTGLQEDKDATIVLDGLPVNGTPVGDIGVQLPVGGGTPDGAKKKKSKRGLIIGLSAGAAVIIIAVVVFLIFFLSADSRFGRAMEEKDYETAESILSGGGLSASEENDAYYLTLAGMYLDKFKSGKYDYDTAVQKLITLRSAETYSKKTSEKIESNEKTVIDTYLTKPYNAYGEGELDYDSALKQIKDCKTYDDKTAQNKVNEYVEKMEEKRDEVYVNTLGEIADQGKNMKLDSVIEKLEEFGDYRDSKTIIGILSELKKDDGVAAAKLLVDYNDKASKDSDDPELTSDVYDGVKSYILGKCLDVDSVKDQGKKIQKRLGRSYAMQLMGDSSLKAKNMFEKDTTKSVNIGKTLDLKNFKSAKGGTGKIAYVTRYLSNTSASDYKEYYYYRLEDKKDIPFDKTPESVEDIEYLVIYDEGCIPYATYTTDSGKSVSVYQSTVQITVRQYPTGKVIYDSGVLKGPTPPDTMTVATGTKHAFGDKPKITDAVKDKVKKAVGLK